MSDTITFIHKVNDEPYYLIPKLDNGVISVENKKVKITSRIYSESEDGVFLVYYAEDLEGHKYPEIKEQDLCKTLEDCNTAADIVAQRIKDNFTE